MKVQTVDLFKTSNAKKGKLFRSQSDWCWPKFRSEPISKDSFVYIISQNVSDQNAPWGVKLDIKKFDVPLFDISPSSMNPGVTTMSLSVILMGIQNTISMLTCQISIYVYKVVMAALKVCESRGM